MTAELTEYEAVREGRRAYETYCMATNYVAFNGELLSAFVLLPRERKDAWIAAARAIWERAVSDASEPTIKSDGATDDASAFAAPVREVNLGGLPLGSVVEITGYGSVGSIDLVVRLDSFPGGTAVKVRDGR